MPSELARCQAAAELHAASVHVCLGRLLARSGSPATQAEGIAELSSVTIHVQEAVPASASEQPWLLGTSEQDAAVSSLLPDLPPHQQQQPPVLELQHIHGVLSISQASTGAQLQGCQLQGGGLAVHAGADHLLAGLALASSAMASAQRAKEALGPLLLSRTAAAAADAAETAAQQTSELPAASAGAAAVADAAEAESQAQAGNTSVGPSSRKSKLGDLAARLSVTVHMEAVSATLQVCSSHNQACGDPQTPHPSVRFGTNVSGALIGCAWLSSLLSRPAWLRHCSHADG